MRTTFVLNTIQMSGRIVKGNHLIVTLAELRRKGLTLATLGKEFSIDGHMYRKIDRDCWENFSRITGRSDAPIFRVIFE